MPISCVYSDAQKSAVIFDWGDGRPTQTVASDWPGRFRVIDDAGGVIGFLANGGTIAPYVAPAPSTNPADYTLTKRQVCAALILAGVTDDPNGFVLNVLSTIADTQAKALAINDWNYAPYYTRTNALFNDPSLLGASGITPQQIDQFWLLGAQQPA